MLGPERPDPWHISCKTCGHWRRGFLDRNDIADWFRIHPQPVIRAWENWRDVPPSQSTCPRPCGA